MFGVKRNAAVSGLYQASELKAKLFSKELEILRLRAESEFNKVLDELLRIKDNNNRLRESGLMDKLEQEKSKWNSDQLRDVEQRIEQVDLLVKDCSLYVDNIQSQLYADNHEGFGKLGNAELEEQLETLSFSKVLYSSASEYFYNSKEFELYSENTPNTAFLHYLKDQITALYDNRAA
ncbi:DNA repair protein [Vibrio parahaemolyticus]|uniref:DNA repair protein n=1 Tax=Vibrio parahaemolyticus TaxID=670 RepID=UPI0029E1CB4C|nr:DNA repair protein [Vibrio parahaemolyticus]